MAHNTFEFVPPVSPEREAEADQREAGERGDVRPGRGAGAGADGAERELAEVIGRQERGDAP